LLNQVAISGPDSQKQW